MSQPLAQVVSVGTAYEVDAAVPKVQAQYLQAGDRIEVSRSLGWGSWFEIKSVGLVNSGHILLRGTSENGVRGEVKFMPEQRVRRIA